MLSASPRPHAESVEHWRLLPYDVGPSDRHFALSDSLARCATEPTVWAHSTDTPTLILGPAQKEIATALPTDGAAQVLVVRRHAGGTAVLAVPGVLGIDVALPAGHRLLQPDVVEAYRWLGEVWVGALRGLGVDAHLVTVEEARGQPRSDELTETVLRLACFGALSPYEVTAAGRKLVGLAQVRRSRATVWQSAIHLRFDAGELVRLLGIQEHERVADLLDARATGLQDILGQPVTLPAVMRAFNSTVEAACAVQLRSGRWTADELAHAAASSSGVTRNTIR